ncbi:hypothetical protein HaLaN_08395 [Haematococcus lacustris]|uniref:Uncharacterized protein n=1 Tax=Haematococcus lacustris TaxID=44745 RepID=A0A699YZ33_HAELA|nr:hypothetical protein HaLaN_08395 [Haematococcus lacustris]
MQSSSLLSGSTGQVPAKHGDAALTQVWVAPPGGPTLMAPAVQVLNSPFAVPSSALTQCQRVQCPAS